MHKGTIFLCHFTSQPEHNPTAPIRGGWYRTLGGPIMDIILFSSIEKYRQDHDLVEACQLAMHQIHPRLLVRWSRIYGSRWAYLGGGSAETICLNPVRIKISPEYGICIDNVDLISSAELAEISAGLKESFAYAAVKS